MVRSYGGVSLLCPGGFPEAPPVYLIVGPKEFMNATLPLLQWRWMSGTPAYYLTLQEANRSSGRDLGESIHTALASIKRAAPTFQFLLLLGDSEVIPPRELYTWAASSGYPYDDFYYSDVYWAGLDSTWDDDGDGKYGEYNFTTRRVEGDFDFDLYVGRFPVNTVEEVENVVGRVVRYERNPRLGNWMKRVIIWASLMDPPNQLDPESPYYYEPWRDNAYKVGEAVRRMLPTHMLNMTLYDYPQLEGGNYTPEVDQLNRQNMLQQFNMGSTIVNFIGQARYNGNALNDYADPTGKRFLWNEPFGYFDYNTLQNGDMLPLMYASTCDSAKFWETDDTNLERLVTTTQGGLLALISSTGTSARLETETDSFGNWWLNREFMHTILYDTHYPGEALYRVKEEYVREKLPGHPAPLILVDLYGYVLLGDPAVPIWREIPPFPTLQDIRLFAGEGEYSLRVVDGSGIGIEGVRVVLYNSDYYRVFTTGPGGYANVTLNLTEGWTLNYTLCGGAVYPKMGAIEVEAGRPDLKVYFKGDKEDVQAVVVNAGSSVAENVTLRVEVAEELYWQEGGVWERERMESGEVWVVSLRDNLSLPGGPTHLRATVSTISPEITTSNNRAEIETYLTHPVLYISPLSVIPARTVPPETAVHVSWQVRNGGNRTAENISYVLYLGDPDAGGIVLYEGVFPVQIPPTQMNALITTFTPLRTGDYYLVLDPAGVYYQKDRSVEKAYVHLEVNQPPRFSPGYPEEIFLQEDTNETVDLYGWVYDPDNRTSELLIRITSSCPNIVTLKEGRYLVIKTPENWWGEIEVNLTVSDGISTIYGVIPIHVLEVNDPPHPLDTPWTFRVVEDIPFRFVLGAVDPDGDNVTFQGEGEFFTLLPNGTLTGVAGQKDVGIHPYRITVKDSRGESVVVDLIIEVEEVNDPPVVKPVENRSVRVGEKLTVRIEAWDEEGDRLTYRSLTPGVSVDPTTGRLTYIPRPSDVGVQKIRVSVSDGVNYVYLIINVSVLPAPQKEGRDMRWLYPVVATAIGAAVIAAIFIIYR
ncbi:MAG: hypothetical protein J7L88_00085, partial [Thermoplasmata archaeon]|nr:hypothetical protein [Thermoplasmata archaeon]